MTFSTLTGISSSENLVAHNLERIASQSWIFVSMPCIAGITPRVLIERGCLEPAAVQMPGRCYGTFRPDELGLPVFDHGLLYGDGVFEGVLSIDGRLFQWREHLERLYRSAERLKITIPYTPAELTEHILDSIHCAELQGEGATYLRLVVTRGIGDLGIDPAKCAGCTIYCIISRIQLYPESVYEQGIHLALATQVRRSSAETLDPRIKSCNYLNNILALLETTDRHCPETLMLNQSGFVAEATTDNIFLLIHGTAWETDPSQVRILTPAASSCLNGITRELVLLNARKLGFSVVESPSLLVQDFAGLDKEAFLTGTAAGLVPVTAVNGMNVGDGVPGPVTRHLRHLLGLDLQNPAMGLPLQATHQEITRYLMPPRQEDQGSLGRCADLISQLFQTVDARQWEELRSFFCDDITYERPGYEPMAGIERLLHFYRKERVIESGHHLLDAVVLDQDHGACWGRFVGKHRNGSDIDERFADTYTFENGRIKTRTSFFFRPAV